MTALITFAQDSQHFHLVTPDRFDSFQAANPAIGCEIIRGVFAPAQLDVGADNIWKYCNYG
jgi:hypothetical protein